MYQQLLLYSCNHTVAAIVVLVGLSMSVLIVLT